MNAADVQQLLDGERTAHSREVRRLERRVAHYRAIEQTSFERLLKARAAQTTGDASRDLAALQRQLDAILETWGQP
jgi:hypothetical protein